MANNGTGKTRMSNPDQMARDRQQSQRLNFIANGANIPNHRDASNPAQSRPLDPKSTTVLDKSGPIAWLQGTLNPIAIPQQGRMAPPSAYGNPYSKITNNLHARRNDNLGNNSREKSSVLMSAKKRKTEHGGQREANMRSRHFVQGNAGPSRQPAHKPEIITLEDDLEEEDTGVVLMRPTRSSPDPLNSFPDAQSDPEDSDHPFERKSPPRTAIPDTVKTVAMREKLEKMNKAKLKTNNKPGPGETVDLTAEDSADPIEPWDSEQPRKGRVQTIREMFEPNSTVGSNRPIRAEKQKQKQIDLLVQGRQGLGKKDKMKKKGPQLKFTPIEPKDPLATAPSGFHTSGKKTANDKTQSKRISLVVDAFMLGTHLTESDEKTQLWFHYDPAHSGEILITKGEVFPWQKYQIDHLVQSVKFTKPSAVSQSLDQLAILIIQTNKTLKGQRGPQDQPRTFKSGADGILGSMSIKFNTEGANWQNGQRYGELVSVLEKRLDYKDILDCHATKTLWKTLSAQGLFGHVDDNTTPALASRKKRAAEKKSNDDDSRSISSVRSSSTAQRAASDVQSAATSRGTRSSARLRQPTADRSAGSASRPPSPDADELLLVYPFTGPGAVNVTRGDLKRLEPNQYLNDILIEFGLKLWLADLRATNPELADQVHLFGSYFYQKLNVRNKEQGYQSVRKWTSRIDIFSKKYLIVPINEHLHWYLAIICNPEYTLRPPETATAPSTSRPMTRKRKRENEESCQEAGIIEDEDDQGDTESVPTADSAHLADGSSSTTRTASAPPSVSISRQRSPSNEVIPDSEPEQEPVPTQRTEEKRMDEREVEDILDLERTLSIHDETDHRPIALAPEDRDVEMVDADAPLGKLAYPSASPESMQVDLPAEISLPVETVLRDPASLFDDSSGPVPVESFYATSVSAPGKRKEEDIDLDISISVECPEEDEPPIEVLDTDAQRPFVFTFDSLGSKHPKAANVLSEYLAMEAKDKKGIEQTTSPKSRTALVPYQPNYCDCGIYVLHFVKMFMGDPLKFMRIAQTRTSGKYSAVDRNADWDSAAIAGLRDSLTQRTLELSGEWRKLKEEEMKAAAELAAANGETSEPASVVVDDGDSDVEIIGMGTRPPIAPTPKGRGPKAKPKPQPAATVKTRASVMRLRDGTPR
ncbi:hypothetical protein EIP91_009091 [Steccherinum ochraceum]|uniref:Ubiquitin-like protease family profile domain-containing protein n=1 Tax=Steccherinum ochraceum TaxID=92696 RepID=A0A4R0RXX2_9APHY|nr:hypothetical protein EIP91_009091 [Steccherinum ochraceum]